MENMVLDAAGFDAWQARYDADVAACEAAGDYPFAGYTDLQQQVFDIVHAREGVAENPTEELPSRTSYVLIMNYLR